LRTHNATAYRYDISANWKMHTAELLGFDEFSKMAAVRHIEQTFIQLHRA